MKKLLRPIFKIMLYIWILFILVLGAWFTHENQQSIQVTFLGYQLPEFTAAVYLVSSIVFGALLGSFITFSVMQTKVSSSKRKLKKAKRETEKLKAIDQLPSVS